MASSKAPGTVISGTSTKERRSEYFERADCRGMAEESERTVPRTE